PTLRLAAPPCRARTAHPVVANEETKRVQRILGQVVQTYGRAHDNPWAVSHAMLALGPDLTLDNGRAAVDHLFETYAEEVDVGGRTLVHFPAARGSTRIEPHADLLLKALTEGGVSPERKVTVGGRPHTVADLYRHSLHSFWVEGERVSCGEWDDVPWTLQGLVAWANGDASWVGANGKRQSLDRATAAAAERLGIEYRPIQLMQRQWERAGRLGNPPFARDGQAILSYTCGGAHLLQGVAYAVGAGLGGPEARRTLEESVSAMRYRLRAELAVIDRTIAERPSLVVPLLAQRLKFTGHMVESLHKLSAVGLLARDSEAQADVEKAQAELVRTVLALEQSGLFDRMPALREDGRPELEQLYLDIVGDSAHALRGLGLAAGEATLCHPRVDAQP
ncbi:MAG: hypothetical protein AAGA56_10555, partial [Myxococcota bacterium]